MRLRPFWAYLRDAKDRGLQITLLRFSGVLSRGTNAFHGLRVSKGSADESDDLLTRKFAPPLGQRLVDLRTDLGWKQADLARHADVAPSTLTGLERGKRLPTMRIALRLAAALGLGSVEELFGSASPSSEAVREARRLLPRGLDG